MERHIIVVPSGRDLKYRERQFIGLKFKFVDRGVTSKDSIIGLYHKYEIPFRLEFVPMIVENI